MAAGFIYDLCTDKDFKPIIISIGILGTFVGILYGLWNFKTDDITNSVPELLKGLKLAFATSVLGMLLSIVLSIVENFKKQASKDILTMLHSILNEQKEANKTIKMIFDSTKESQNTVKNHFESLNQSLKQALEALSKNAVKEIISSLQNVVADFNKNLKEQFGENFKQLNESVKKMIQWQENYKTTIEQTESVLKNAAEGIEKTSEQIQNITHHYQTISVLNKDLHQIIKTNQNQINNIETHLANLKRIGQEAGLITQSINDFSKTIQHSLSGQSEGLRRLNKELDQSLSKSLGGLNSALTTLTDKFRQDYENYLKQFKELLNLLDRDKQ